MPRTTLVAGTTITAAWANANVRDQVVTPFASASARDSAITSPIDGQFAYLTDTNMMVHYNGTVWAPVNNNIVGRHVLTGNSAVYSVDSTTDFAIASCPVLSTRLYKVTLKSDYILAWSAGEAIWSFDFHVDGVLTDSFHTIDRTSTDRTVMCGSILWEPTSGTKALSVRLDVSLGTSTVQFVADANSQRAFWVEDIGPR
jgi:hypothetical protein